MKTTTAFVSLAASVLGDNYYNDFLGLPTTCRHERRNDLQYYETKQPLTKRQKRRQKGK